MKRLSKLLFHSTLLLLIFVSICFSSTILYVTSDSAELKNGSYGSSATIVELERGTMVTLIAEEGRWAQVATQESQIGWIYRGKVSEEKPQIEKFGEDEDGIGGLLGGLSGSDIRADAADSSRSIRGLSPEAKEYAQATGTPRQSQDALTAMIERKIEDREIETFLKNGKIGEYAE